MTHAHTTLEKHPICETPIDFEPGAARNYVKKVVRNPQVQVPPNFPSGITTKRWRAGRPRRMRHRSKRWSAGHLHAPAATPWSRREWRDRGFSSASERRKQKTPSTRSKNSVSPVAVVRAACARGLLCAHTCDACRRKRTGRTDTHAAAFPTGAQVMPSAIFIRPARARGAHMSSCSTWA